MDRRKDHKTHSNGDPDVIVKDTGSLLKGNETPYINAHHPGIAIEAGGKHGGEILRVAPASYYDSSLTLPIDLGNATELSIKFGHGREVRWQDNPGTMVLDLGGGGHVGSSFDDWVVDGDQIGKLDLKASRNGNETAKYSNKKVSTFTIHLRP